jgi:3-oxosteroid 1-dehydrogenase
MQHWDEETGLLVFGSGAGGLAAAVVGATEGLEVMLCEKDARLGGTTATSGGAIWIPCSAQARAAGIADTPERALEYIRSQAGNLHRADLAEAFIGTGPEALDYLARVSEIRFELADMPDYLSDAPGGLAGGRTLLAAPFDGRRLGADFALVRPPMKRLMVLGGLMIGRKEIPQFLRPFSSLANFRHVAGVLARYGADRLRHPRGTRLLLGNALVARGVFSLRRLGAAIRPATALVALVREGGRVVGAEVMTPEGRRRIRARNGVVLATGGIPRSPALRQELMGDFPHDLTLACEHDRGDGLQAARQVGAVADTALASPGFWTPASVLREADGSETVFPYGHLDRGKPGAIAVDADGRRFVNEAESYHRVVMAMFAHRAASGRDAFHLLCDHAFILKYGFGLVRPQGQNLRRMLAMGYLTRAETLDELAAAIGADPAVLRETVAEHNAAAERGGTDRFGKGSTAFNRWQGDSAAGANPCLAPLGRAPFYALRIRPATLGAAVGLATDADGRVRDAMGAPIEGLYACGNEMASVMRGHYLGGGITLGPAIVFGYRAARHAAAARGC